MRSEKREEKKKEPGRTPTGAGGRATHTPLYQKGPLSLTPLSFLCVSIRWSNPHAMSRTGTGQPAGMAFGGANNGTYINGRADTAQGIKQDNAASTKQLNDASGTDDTHKSPPPPPQIDAQSQPHTDNPTHHPTPTRALPCVVVLFPFL